MGLKCSLLGHSFEAADVEREREEQGSEVVTVVREIERCSRCGAERVVSENTEVTAVVDAEDVGLDADDLGGQTTGSGPGGGIGGAVERSGAAEDAGDASSGDEAARRTAEEAAAAVDELAESPEDPGEEYAARDPEEEDAEILTDEEPEREPGEWPEEARGESWGEDDADGGGADGEESDEPESGGFDVDDVTEPAPDLDEPEEESLSGITVPEGSIVCPECGFEVDPESSYREGDPCPECSAWLTSERNP